MDILSLYYFSELAKDLNMTRTARRLSISQQRLSNRIMRLEAALGVQLLNRKPVLSLTMAGDRALEYATSIIKEYSNMTDALLDIQQQEKGIIRFGASALRLNIVLPNILPTFSIRHPNVEIHIIDAYSEQLEPMILNGNIDYAIVLSDLSDKHSQSLIVQSLLNDQVYLCVSDHLLYSVYGEQAETIKESAIHGVAVAELSQLPFCLYFNQLGAKIQECFEEVGITPRLYTISADTQISLSLCFEGLAACFATRMHLFDQRNSIPDNLNIFPVLYQGEPLVQQLSLIHCRNRYLTQYAKHFADLILSYFVNMEREQIERLSKVSYPN